MDIKVIDENGGESWISWETYYKSIKQPDCDHDLISPGCTVLTKFHNSNGSRLICIVCRAERYSMFAKDLSAIGGGHIKEIPIPEDMKNDPKFGSRHGVCREEYPVDRLATLQKKLDELTDTVKWLAKLA